MEIIHEQIDCGDHIPVKVFVHELGESMLHWHESIELLFVLENSVTLKVATKEYFLTEGDIHLINAYVPHELHAANCVLAVIQIHLSLFDDKLIRDQSNPMFFSCSSLNCSEKNAVALERIKKICALFLRNYASSSQDRLFRAKSLSYELLAELIASFLAEGEPEQSYLFYQHERITRITDYINEHYHEHIPLQSIADREFLSPQYLSNLFRKSMGISFIQYLNQIRTQHAINDMRKTDDSIETIAERNGFSNVKSFASCMKRNYGCLPSEYRKNFKSLSQKLENSNQFQNDYTIWDTRQYLNRFAKLLDVEDFRSAHSHDEEVRSLSREIDCAGPQHELRHTFKNFISVGCAHDILYKDVQDMLTQVQREIGFKYIKFHGILSDDLHVYSVESGTSEPQYCFVYVDKVIDFLMSIQLKPMLQLSFMPKALASQASNYIFNTTMINSAPNSLSKWCDFMKCFVMHLIDRYGHTEVESWIFTVWNEPNTPCNMFGFPKEVNFYELYQATYESIIAVDPHLQIASPSVFFDPNEEKSWFQRFSQWSLMHNCLPQCVLFHCYGSEMAQIPVFEQNKEGKLHLTTDENYLSKCISRMKQHVEKFYPPNTKIYLTEWNYTPFHRDLLGDTCFRSCYIAKNILENYDQIESFGYWTLTDMLAEHPLKEDLFHGGLGLFTYNGVKKAAYYAFALLAQLGNNLIDKGDGYFITSSGNSYQIILYNYIHYSNLYASGEMFDMTYTERYTPFIPKRKMEYNLCLKGLPARSWNVTEYIVNREHGSSFDTWVTMGGEALSGDREIDALSKLSLPMMKKSHLRSDEHGLNLHGVLDLLEVRLILVE